MANRTNYLKMYMLARGTHTHHFDVLRVQVLKIEHIALNTKKKIVPSCSLSHSTSLNSIYQLIKGSFSCSINCWLFCFSLVSLTWQIPDAELWQCCKLLNDHFKSISKSHSIKMKTLTLSDRQDPSFPALIGN